MNTALALITSVFLSHTGLQTPGQAPATGLANTTLQRTYRVGEESKYTLALSDTTQTINMKATFSIKTLALLPDGKASQELSTAEITGGPRGMSAPEKVTWTFAKDGLAASNFDVKSGNFLYSLFSAFAYLPGQVQQGKEFKFAWTSTDKQATMTGKGTYDGAKDVNGKQLAIISSTIDVVPGTQGDGKVRNTALFDPATGKLISAEGTIEVNSSTMTFSVTSA